MDVAVVILTYNQADYAATAIDSVLDQTHPPAQIVVTDDGSSDGTQEIIREYESRHPDTIVPVLSDRNQGIPQNYNQGLQEVSADAVTFLAGDDRFRPEKLEHEAAAIRNNPDVGVAYSNFVYVDGEGNEGPTWADSPPPTGDVLVPCLARDWPNDSLFRNPMVSWDVLERTGFYDESLAVFEDWDMKIRLSSVTRVAYCDAVLTEYRRAYEGVSTTLDWETKAEMFERVYAKHSDRIDALDEDDRRHVRRELDAMVHRFRAFVALENGDRLRAWREYASALRATPRRWTDYPVHLRILLPRRGFDLLAGTKRSAEAMLSKRRAER